MSQSLIQLFSAGLNVPEESLSDESSPDNVVQWDSVAAMDLVALIESRYHVQLSTKEIMSMRTIGKAREVLMSKGVELH